MKSSGNGLQVLEFARVEDCIGYRGLCAGTPEKDYVLGWLLAGIADY